MALGILLSLGTASATTETVNCDGFPLPTTRFPGTPAARSREHQRRLRQCRWLAGQADCPLPASPIVRRWSGGPGTAGGDDHGVTCSADITRADLLSL